MPTPLMDPELAPFLDLLPKIAFQRDFLPAFRAGMIAQFANAPDDALAVTNASHTTPGGEGAPPVRILGYTPRNTTFPLPAVLHIHGGGYVIGTAEMSQASNRQLAADLGCAVFSVDYRLAPETPHPGPIEDCYAALAWIHKNAAQLGIDPDRIGVKGESAGGGLAASLALLARDRGKFPLAFQHMIYPMLDDRTCTLAEAHPHTGEFVWTRKDNHFGWSSLLGAAPGSPGISPYAAAARAENLAGLPPTFISVGALDLFLEEDLDYARRLTRAGVPVELHVYPGAFHGFDFATTANVVAKSNRNSLDALRRALEK